MMKELETIKIGDGEDLARSLSQEYDGYRRDQEILKQMYEKPDYQYVVQVDPWRFWDFTLDKPLSRFDRMIGTASTAIAPNQRKAIGLRRWSVVGIVSIRQKQVVAVTTQAVVEGRNEWLGGSWYLYERIPDYEIKQLLTHPDIPWAHRDRYLAGWRRLKFNKIDGGGESAESWITPLATQEEKQFASRFDLECFTSRSGCQTICDFVPGADTICEAFQHANPYYGHVLSAAPKPILVTLRDVQVPQPNEKGTGAISTGNSGNSCSCADLLWLSTSVSVPRSRSSRAHDERTGRCKARRQRSSGASDAAAIWRLPRLAATLHRG